MVKAMKDSFFSQRKLVDGNLSYNFFANGCNWDHWPDSMFLWKMVLKFELPVKKSRRCLVVTVLESFMIFLKFFIQGLGKLIDFVQKLFLVLFPGKN